MKVIQTEFFNQLDNKTRQLNIYTETEVSLMYTMTNEIKIKNGSENKI